jgi:hypothetical protein
MTIGADDFCCGEYPPLTSIDFPSPAPEVVDALSPARSDLGGSTTIAEANEALNSLFVEIADLKTRLARAEQARDTAQAQLAHYNQKGW